MFERDSKSSEVSFFVFQMGLPDSTDSPEDQ